MSSQTPLPSPEDDYAPPAGTVWNAATWIAVFGSIGQRLRAVEGIKVAIDDVINELKTFGLQRLDEALLPAINAGLADLEELTALLEPLRQQIDDILAGGIPATSVKIEPAIPGVAATTVQGALAELHTTRPKTGSVIALALALG